MFGMGKTSLAAYMAKEVADLEAVYWVSVGSSYAHKYDNFSEKIMHLQRILLQQIQPTVPGAMVCLRTLM